MVWTVGNSRVSCVNCTFGVKVAQVAGLFGGLKKIVFLVKYVIDLYVGPPQILLLHIESEDVVGHRDECYWVL